MRLEDWREGNCKKRKGNSKECHQSVHHCGWVGLHLPGYLLRSWHRETMLRLFTWETEEVSGIQWCVGACLSQLGTAYCTHLLPTLRSVTLGQCLEINHGGKHLHYGNWWILHIRVLFLRELDVKHWPAYRLKYVSPFGRGSPRGAWTPSFFRICRDLPGLRGSLQTTDQVEKTSQQQQGASRGHLLMWLHQQGPKWKAGWGGGGWGGPGKTST